MLPIEIPDGTLISLDDFQASGVEEILRHEDADTYWGIELLLRSAARRAVEHGEYSKGRVLLILSKPCSLQLNPNVVNEPFRSQRPGIDVDSFEQDEVDFLTEIYPQIQYNKLAARIGDVVWVVTRDYRAAIFAIDNYGMLPLTSESWFTENRECWIRAIRLCKQLRAHEQLDQVEQSLWEALMATTFADEGFIPSIADVLLNHGLRRESTQEVVAKLEITAQQFEGLYHYHLARECYEIAEAWYRKIDNDSEVNRLTMLRASCWEKEADVRLERTSPDYITTAADSSHAFCSERL